VAFGGVAIYAILVGAEASVVRAAIMAALFIFATHSDEEHVAGLPRVIEGYGVDQLITDSQPAQEESYQALMKTATQNAVPIHRARAGENSEIGDGVRLEILYQASDPSSTKLSKPPTGDQHDNDQSVVLRRAVFEDHLAKICDCLGRGGE
jgi:beta-lactamase superfamily II metal-dependent hydrolase